MPLLPSHSFLLLLPSYAFPLHWHGLSLGRIPFGLYLLCHGAPPVALTLFSLPLCVHSRHLSLHFLFFFFFTEAPHTLLMVPRERSICPSEVEGDREEPILSVLSRNTKYEQWLSLRINTLMWNRIHQQEKTVRRAKIESPNLSRERSHVLKWGMKRSVYPY